jgi:transcriptional regulator with XRE-family HTH domain
VSALSDLLNRHIAERHGDTSNRRLAEMAGVSRGTIDNYRKGDHPAVPGEDVLSAFHDLTGLSMQELRTAAGLPPGENEPYEPPAEANLLTRPQRNALDQLIRTIVDARDRHDSDSSDTATAEATRTSSEAGEGEKTKVTPLRRRGRDFGADPIIEQDEAAYTGDDQPTDYTQNAGPDPAGQVDDDGPEGGA